MLGKLLNRISKDEVKLISKLAYPIVLGHLGIVLMGVADTVMVGKLGKVALAGVNQANNIFFLFSGLTFGVLFAVSTLVSIKVGEKRPDLGFITYRAGLLVSVVLFVFQYLILWLLIENFHWLKQSPEIEAIAPAYLQIIAWSVLPMLIFTNCRQFTDGLGHTKISMVLNLAGLGLNVLLNAIMIYGWWGFPALGANGAAWATLITRILMAVAALWYVRYSSLMKQYLPSRMPDFKAIWKETFEIWKIGTPIALQTFAEWACFAISGIMIGWYGSVQLAAHAVALNAASLTYMVASGLSMAGSIRVGNAYGEQSLSSIRRIANMTFFMVVIFEIFNALLFIVFSKQIAGLYGVESDVMPYILPLFFLAAFFQISDGLQAAAMSVLRGIKDVVWASIISIIAYWVVSLPLSYLFGEILHKGVYGVWMGFSAGLFLAALLGVYKFYYQWKRIKFLPESTVAQS